MEETSGPAGRFAPARVFPAQHGLIRWGPDYAPRVSAVYDLLGDGRTALKTSFAKYHRQYDADPFLTYADAGLRQENRNWFDCSLNPAGTACSGVALVEAQGQGLRRRHGSARRAVPRSDESASLRRQREMDVDAPQFVSR